MTKRLTDEELAEIRERAEKASEGPWDVDVPVDYCTNCNNEYEIVQSELFLAPIVAELKNREDAEFIAHAREDIPKLLAEIERYREAIEEAIEYANSPKILTSPAGIEEILSKALESDNE